MLIYRFFKVLLASLFTMVLASCGGAGGQNSLNYIEPEPPTPKGLLISSDTEQKFLEVFSNAIIEDGEAYLSGVNEEQPVRAAEDTERSFTTTYALETSVDEHDIVKYDGDHLFIAPTRSMDCCFVFSDVARIAGDQANEDPNLLDDERGIRILSTDSDSASASLVSTITIDDGLTVEGLYNMGSTLVSLKSSSWWGTFGQEFSRSWAWEGQTSAIDIYDITNVEQPVLQWAFEMKGGFVTSRRVEENIYLISRHTPNIPGLIRYPATQEDIDSNKLLLDEITAQEILPEILINGERQDLVDVNECLFMDKSNTNASAVYGFPVMTFIVALDLESQRVLGISCYMGSTSGVYVSENAIYLTQSDGQYEESRTLIHAFAVADTLPYEGSGVVEGHLWGRGELDFRISEHKEYLRVVTTTQIASLNEEDSIDHQLSILKLSSETLRLNLVTTLPNASRPEKIGKPDESLYGVRFFGETLYLVTFETIDPLYVLDLNDPEDPIIAGELTIPGFSDFLHPVNNDLLLGLGADDQGLVKLELFNVSNISAPYSLGTHSLGDGSWSHSEARYNRHAFTYLKYGDSVDRFTVPITEYGIREDVYYEQNSLYMLELTGKNSPAVASIEEIGYIKSATNNWWNSGPHRSVIDGDAVYFIDGSSVYSALWSNPFEQGGPF